MKVDKEDGFVLSELREVFRAEGDEKQFVLSADHHVTLLKCSDGALMIDSLQSCSTTSSLLFIAVIYVM